MSLHVRIEMCCILFFLFLRLPIFCHLHNVTVLKCRLFFIFAFPSLFIYSLIRVCPRACLSSRSQLYIDLCNSASLRGLAKAAATAMDGRRTCRGAPPSIEPPREGASGAGGEGGSPSWSSARRGRTSQQGWTVAGPLSALSLSSLFCL